MENPFLLAVALLESREITDRFLARTKGDRPDSRSGGEGPIDWRLLVDVTVRPEVTAANASNSGRPRKGGALHDDVVGEGGRTAHLEHVARSSCA